VIATTAAVLVGIRKFIRQMTASNKAIKTRNKQTNKQNVNMVDKLSNVTTVTINYSHQETM